MDENMNNNEEVMTIELTFDNDETLECAVICIFEANEKDYIALLPVDSEPDEDGEEEVLIYKYLETEDGGTVIENIDDDDEYDAAADAFDEWVAEQE